MQSNLNKARRLSCRDHHGSEVCEQEMPDKKIVVWEIIPSMDTGYDSAVIRCYQDAVEYAKLVVEDLMDDPDREYPVTVTIGQREFILDDYLELCDEDCE